MVFACGGDGDGDATDAFTSSSGGSPGLWGYSQEDIYEIFGRPPGGVSGSTVTLNPPPEKILLKIPGEGM